MTPGAAKALELLVQKGAVAQLLALLALPNPRLQGALLSALRNLTRSRAFACFSGACST